MLDWLDQASRIYRRTLFLNGIGTGIELKVARVRYRFTFSCSVFFSHTYTPASSRPQITIYESSAALGNPFNPSTSSAYVFLDQLSTGKYDGYCLAHAFTNQDFANGVIGLANVGTICASSGSGTSSNGMTVYSTNTGITTTVNYGSTNPELQVKRERGQEDAFG